jgi:FKBP-type peptidyl-prolyl cis-trans isomerase FklB
MKKLFTCFVILLGCFSSLFAQTKPKASAEFKNAVDSFSYAAGVSIAESMKAQGIEEVNISLISKAFTDVFKKKSTAMSSDQCQKTVQEKLQQFMQKKSAVQLEKNKQFFAENKKRNGVTALPNGLQYEVLSSGPADGAKPTPADTVVVHYVGTLTDGKEFDNSVKRGEPAEFPLGGVIRGWTEILQLMSPGDKWKVYIPSELGYGERGAGGSIPGNAILIFEINLLNIKPAVNK